MAGQIDVLGIRETALHQVGPVVLLTLLLLTLTGSGSLGWSPPQPSLEIRGSNLDPFHVKYVLCH